MCAAFAVGEPCELQALLGQKGFLKRFLLHGQAPPWDKRKETLSGLGNVSLFSAVAPNIWVFKGCLRI